MKEGQNSVFFASSQTKAGALVNCKSKILHFCLNLSLTTNELKNNKGRLQLGLLQCLSLADDSVFLMQSNSSRTRGMMCVALRFQDTAVVSMPRYRSAQPVRRGA